MEQLLEATLKMNFDYNIILPIIFGFITIGLVKLKKKKLGLPKLAFLFLMGAIAYGGLASLYLGLTGDYLFVENMDSYRIWISLSGLVLLWLFQDVIRKERK